jgi:predicted amidohydrolase
MFASLYIEEPERNPILYSSERYILGIGVLAGLYHKLHLFRLNKLMIILSTVPILSHIAGKFWGEVLQGIACPTGLRPYLVG